MHSPAASTDGTAVHIEDDGFTVRRGARGSHLPRRSGRHEQLERQVQPLLERMNVAIVFGGDKTAHGAVIHQTGNLRSWKSYQPVAEDIAGALQRLGCRSVRLMPDDMTLGEQLRENEIHFAWLNTGGVQGYDPMAHAAAMLEMFGIPYVGHDPLTASILDNKHAFKRQITALEIPTAPFISWHLAHGGFSAETNERFIRAFGDFSGPFIVKPVCGRASLHVHVADSRADLTEAVAHVYHATENHVLIERYLPGREFAVAICGPVVARERRLSQLGQPFVFSAVERVLSGGEQIFTSMDVRPITTDRLRLLDPSADARVLAQLEGIARTVFQEMDLETLIRLDLRMDDAGRLYVLEANPKPDLMRPTEQKTSIVCAGLSACGMDYDDLILSLLADRIDLLFCQRRGLATNLFALLD